MDTTEHLQERAPDDDATLVRGSLGGELSCFELLLRRYNQRLYRIARAQLHDDAEAEDAAQQAWVQIYTALAQWTGRGSFAGWAASIVINVCRQRRRHTWPSEPLDEVDEASIDAPAPDEALHQAQVKAVLQHTVEELPVTLRGVFVMRDVEGLSGAETAEALGISEELVRVRLHRARGALKQSLDSQFAGQGRSLYSFLGPRCDRLTHAVLEQVRRQTDL